MKTRALLVSGLTLALAGPSAAQQASAPLMTKAGPIGAAPLGKGQIVFYRPGSMMGMALGCTVREGEAQVARLGSGKFFAVVVQPGKHIYSTRGEARMN